MIFRGFLKDAGHFLRMPLFLIFILISPLTSPVNGLLHPKFHRQGQGEYQDLLDLNSQHNNPAFSSPSQVINSRSLDIGEGDQVPDTGKSDQIKRESSQPQSDEALKTQQSDRSLKPSVPYLPLHFGLILHYFNSKSRTSVHRKRFSVFPEGGYSAAAESGTGSIPYSYSKMYRHRYCFFNPVSCFRR